jgi:outer membrane protein assembly factor BamB
LAAQDGTKQWAYSLAGFTVSSPALSPDGETVYVGIETSAGGGRVLAIPRGGSAPRWSVNRPSGIVTSPAVGSDGTVYIGGDDGKFLALNPANGAVLWQIDTRTFVTSSAAIGADGTIYFGAGDFNLWAVNRDGSTRWKFSTGSWIDSSPAIAADGTIYFGSNDRNVYAVTPAGEERWHFATGSLIAASPAIGADGTVYVGSLNQKIYALRPEDGSVKWERFTNGEIRASPVLGADGTVYVASTDRNFYALRPEDGTVRWKTDFGAVSWSSAAVRADGVIIFGTDNGFVYALNPDDGSVRWRFSTPTGDIIESSPMIAPDGAIYVGSLDGFLYKLNGNGTSLSTLSAWPAFHRDPQRQGRALAVSSAGRLLNLSTRAQVSGTDTLIAGFSVQGSGDRAYLMRGIGPALAAFGLVGMPDPMLRVFTGGTPIGSNDDWGNNEGGLSVRDTGAAVGAFPLPDGSKDAALVLPLSAGPYTTHITAADGRGGVVLAEAYDAVGGDENTRLVNVSTRGQVGVGANALFAGVVVGGTGKSRLLIRAVGPGLTQFGVSGVLERPTLSLFGGDQRLIRTNSGWTTDNVTYDLVAAARLTGAFALAANSADCALIAVVDPGVYTVQVSGVSGTTGEALVEIYKLP